MVIQNNLNAINANNKLRVNVIGTKKSTEKLSSGFRINRAGDDAAGLAVSEKMRTQLKGLGQAIRNTNDGISFIQTAEGALDETHSMLKRIKELATQAATGTYTDDDRAFMQQEVNALLTEMNRISEATDFNGIRMLNGSLSFGNTTAVLSGNIGGASAPAPAMTGLVVQIGDRNGEHTRMNVSIEDMSAWALFTAGTNQRPTMTGAALTQLVNITSQYSAIAVLGALGTNGLAEVAAVATAGVGAAGLHGQQGGTIDNAIYRVSRQRAELGALQNRVEYTANSLTATHENVTAAESQIRDTDMATEMVKYTKYSILQQAAQAMLAQANQAPQAILQLLR